MRVAVAVEKANHKSNWTSKSNWPIMIERCKGGALVGHARGARGACRQLEKLDLGLRRD